MNMNWKKLASPSVGYINDHCIYEDREGFWHLIGTYASVYRTPLSERRFFHAKGRSPFCLEPEKMDLDGSCIFRISPFVFRSERWHLFFATGLCALSHRISDDGIRWKKARLACFGSPFMRDPCIISHQGRTVLYLTEFGNRINAYLAADPDLRTWKFLKTVFRLGQGSPRSFNSACESPFVLRTERGFILLTTIVPSPIGRTENYLSTFAFASDDLLEFGTYPGDVQMIKRIECHAPEVFAYKGKKYITTCGWKGFPKPEGCGEGVWYTELSLF